MKTTDPNPHVEYAGYRNAGILPALFDSYEHQETHAGKQAGCLRYSVRTGRLAETAWFLRADLGVELRSLKTGPSRLWYLP